MNSSAFLQWDFDVRYFSINHHRVFWLASSQHKTPSFGLGFAIALLIAPSSFFGSVYYTRFWMAILHLHNQKQMPLRIIIRFDFITILSRFSLSKSDFYSFSISFCGSFAFDASLKWSQAHFWNMKNFIRSNSNRRREKEKRKITLKGSI